MPLLKADQFGNIYQYGFGDDIQKAEITSNDGNVVLDGYSKKETQVRAIAAKKAKADKLKARAIRQQKILLRKKKQAAKQARINQLKKMQRLQKQAFIRRQNEEYLRVVKAGKNPFTGAFKSAGRGNELVGFKTPAQVVSRKNMGKGKVQGVKNAANYGNTMLKEYNWPPKSRFSSAKSKVKSGPVKTSRTDAMKLMGLNPVSYNTQHPMASAMTTMGQDGMGFRIRMPKFRMPRINIRLPQVKLPNIKVPSLDRVISDVGKGAGQFLQATNPITHLRKVAMFLPGVRDVYKGLDKLTGNTLTSLERVTDLPARALKGEGISKADLIEAAMMALKVGAIVVSGGSAVAIIGAAAGALKNGPLGQTPLGNAILSIGEVAGLAYGAGQGLAKAMSKKVTDMVSAEAATEVGKKAGPLGAIAASVAVASGSAGFNSPGSSIANGATAASAKQAVAVAGKVAAKATEKLAESGMKFSTEAATAEAKKLVIAQAKSHVANEFKAKTGIPLGVAMDVANGKVPSPTEIKKQLLTDLRNTPDKLRAELAKIPKQKDMADFAMKKVLEEKERVYEREITQRIKDVKKVKEMGAKELMKYNSAYKIKAELYNAKINAMQTVATKAKGLRGKAMEATTNMADKLKFDNEATKEEAHLLVMKNESDPLANEIATMSVTSEEIKQDNAARLAIAEYGGKTKFTEGTGIANDIDFRHPMLIYGLV